jgi:hypothetical protein
MGEVQKRDKMMSVTDDYRSDLLNDLRDPSYASGYLKAVLSDADPVAISIALKDIAEAYQINVPTKTIDAEYVHNLAIALREQLARMDEMTQKLESPQPVTQRASQVRPSQTP